MHLYRFTVVLTHITGTTFVEEVQAFGRRGAFLEALNLSCVTNGIKKIEVGDPR